METFGITFGIRTQLIKLQVQPTKVTLFECLKSGPKFPVLRAHHGNLEIILVI